MRTQAHAHSFPAEALSSSNTLAYFSCLLTSAPRAGALSALLTAVCTEPRTLPDPQEARNKYPRNQWLSTSSSVKWKDLSKSWSYYEDHIG